MLSNYFTKTSKKQKCNSERSEVCCCCCCTRVFIHPFVCLCIAESDYYCMKHHRHNDLPWNIRKFTGGGKLYSLRLETGLQQQEPWSKSVWSHTDLPRLREGRVGAQVFDSCLGYCYVTRRIRRKLLLLGFIIENNPKSCCCCVRIRVVVECNSISSFKSFIIIFFFFFFVFNIICCCCCIPVLGRLRSLWRSVSRLLSQYYMHLSVVSLVASSSSSSSCRFNVM